MLFMPDMHSGKRRDTYGKLLSLALSISQASASQLKMDFNVLGMSIRELS
jgi:hypothetical protein